MPYGMKGGDTPTKDAKMERCVARVRAEGHDKLSAILICKASIDRGGSKRGGSPRVPPNPLRTTDGQQAGDGNYSGMG